jgi:hypothetical protein
MSGTGNPRAQMIGHFQSPRKLTLSDLEPRRRRYCMRIFSQGIGLDSLKVLRKDLVRTEHSSIFCLMNPDQIQRSFGMRFRVLFAALNSL